MSRFVTFDVQSEEKLTRILRDTETGKDYPFTPDETRVEDLSVAAALVQGEGPNSGILYGVPSTYVDSLALSTTEPVPVVPNADTLARETASA